MRLALKKTARPTLFGPIAHALGCALSKSPYSHIELVFSDGLSASACHGEGVRFKRIAYSSWGAWDFFTMPGAESAARGWFEAHEGQPYDPVGCLRFAWGFAAEHPDGWFCSEAVGAALGWTNPWRNTPGGVLDRCRDTYLSQAASTPWERWPYQPVTQRN